MSHRYIPNTDQSISEMLREIGVSDIWELYSDIDGRYILPRPPDLEGPMTEMELYEHVKNILSKNRSGLKVFVGGGVWPHYIPAAVTEIVSRSEYVTSYTPYQPEASQGVLTALFEFQSMVADLYGVDVVNSSMYDWATAVAEAFLMAHRYRGGHRVLCARYVSPVRLGVARTYLAPAGLKLEEIPHNSDGELDVEALKERLGRDVAAVYVENPTFLGNIMSGLRAVSEVVHDAGSLLVVGAEPTSLGLLRPPGEYGADIVVGEGQPLGLPMSFGGPLMGILGCKMDRRLLQVMPGRLVGLTETLNRDRRAFTMILRTREQDIRRHKATSNICTNQALCAIAAAAYLSILGKRGMQELARHIFAKTAYMIEVLSKNGVEVPLVDAPHYMEFTYRMEGWRNGEILEKLLASGIVGGIPLRRAFPELGDAILTCVTEVHSKEDILKYAGVLAGGRV
ncbi:putative glycine dehydrogenase (decarboxylating) subunit 1 [archaeon HR01]|nr:putative glycine dehydrogenase (decarboxylating) subunit 1 [archaeon HR01]